MAVVAKLGWKVAAALSGAVAGAITERVLRGAWRAVRGDEPPKRVDAPGVSWPEALSWTVATAAGIAVSRLVASRALARGWEAALGSAPPGHAPEPSRPVIDLRSRH
jgi:hypothetical protein